MRRAGSSSARPIILAMRHIPPLVIYEDAPISYMVEGQASRFYIGEGEFPNSEDPEPISVHYFIVRAL